MLTGPEAQQLMDKFIELRSRAHESKSSFSEFRAHEQICIEKLGYLVSMRLGKYKGFSNYEDLKQEGFEALLRGMKTYDPKKGSAFWWFHKYIGTRISRNANAHTAIKYPLKIAKNTSPHKENFMPILIESASDPLQELEHSEVSSAINSALHLLPETDKQIVGLLYGVDGNKSISINKICKKLKISRKHCIRTINRALILMKDSIKI